MGTELQFCMKDNSNRNDSHIFKCPNCGEGILYYPDVKASDIKGNMDTFYAVRRCTECDRKSRDNTAPRYLTWRVVVSV